MPAARQDGASEAKRTAVAVARLVRPHGLRGEVAADLLTDFPQHLIRRRQVILRRPGSDHPPRLITVRSARLHGRQAVFHFDGCRSLSDAEQLVGFEVTVPLADRAPLPEGSYYYSDFIGCDVYEVADADDSVDQTPAPLGTAGVPSADSSSSNAGSPPAPSSFVGTVREVLLLGGPPLLAVETSAGQLLIPFAAEICLRIDLPARRILVRLPDGLRELNR